jgi:hypothetical protein
MVTMTAFALLIRISVVHGAVRNNVGASAATLLRIVHHLPSRILFSWSHRQPGYVHDTFGIWLYVRDADYPGRATFVAQVERPEMHDQMANAITRSCSAYLAQPG